MSFLEKGAERRLQILVAKVKAIGERPFWEDASASQELAGEVAERGAQHKRRNREEGGTPQHGRERLGELCVSHRFGGAGVDGSGVMGVLAGFRDQPGEVVGVHPRYPLAAIAEASPQTE
jgi:hypothetical protein